MPNLDPSPPPHVPPPSGVIALRPRYCECDPMGLVHHASYVPWLEMGRTELLRASGLSYAGLEARGVLLVIVKMDLRYRRPARYDDLLEVRTHVVGGSRIKIEHEYEVVMVEPAQGGSGTPGEVCVAASTTLACVGRDGRPMGLPDWLATR